MVTPGFSGSPISGKPTSSCPSPTYERLRSASVVFNEGSYYKAHPCRSWRCEWCARLTVQDVRRIIRTGLVSAAVDGLPVILLTLTEPSASRSVHESSRSLTLLMKRLQAQNGRGLRWVAVLEWQKRGAPHWHVLIAGLAYCRSTRTKLGVPRPGHARQRYAFEVTKERDLKPVVLRYGFGRVFEVHAVGADSPFSSAPIIAGYLSKYLTKSEAMKSLPRRAQPFKSSRGANQWAAGMSLTSLRREAIDRARLRGRP